MKQVISVTRQETQRVCDICNEANARHSCKMCRRDLCEIHVVFDPRDPSDYPDKYCSRCWAAGEPFREQQSVEIDRHDEAITAIEQQWSDACKILEVKR